MIRLGNDDNQNAAFLRLNGSNNTSAVGGAGSLVLGHGLSKNLHLSTAGASRFAVRSDGKISAGTLLDTNNSYEFSIRGADGTGCLYAHGRNHYLSTRSTSHSSLTLKKSNSDSDGVDYLQLRDSSNAAKLIINGDGTLQVLDSIKHMGDTNTAIRFPANDTVTVETGGSERLRITSAGIHKISTAGDTQDGTFFSTLTINNTGSNTFSRVRFDRSSVARFGLTLRNDDKLCISNLYQGGSVTANDAAFVMDAYSKIGINEASPTARLDINHPHTEQGLVVRSRYGNIATAMVKFDGDPDSDGGDGNVLHLHGGSSRTDSEILHIDSTGVGDIFDIRGDGLTRVYKQLQLEHSSNVAKIIFNEYGANDIKAQIEMDQINGSAGQLIFRTQDGGTLSERLRLVANGPISVNPTSGDGDNFSATALKNDANAWIDIFRESWIGTGGGWGSFWAGSGGAAYRRVPSDNNPNEFVFVGSGAKRFTFDLDSGGHAYFDGTLSQNNYDYAEYFEWEDGNPNNEDRRGYSVFLNANGKIEKATSETSTSDIIGVISGTAAIIGDAAVYDWQGRYEIDEWGTRRKEQVTQVSWTDIDGTKHSYADENDIPSDVVVPDDASRRTHHRYIESSTYDSSQAYVPRDQRREWGIVGLLGKVRVRNDSPKHPNWKYIKTIAGKDLWLIK
jgi:hypothetical protein